MFNPFRHLASAMRGDESPASPPVPSVGEGLRVYAIGDVHGRLDLLKNLLEQIVADNEARGLPDGLRIVLLGDLVDRGPDSAAVVEIVMTMTALSATITCLMGNHEEMFLLALRGDPQGLSLFRRMGRETLQSYGIADAIIDEADDEDLFAEMMHNIPETHRDFLAHLPDSLEIGDYLFVHAGIRPGVPLEAQAGRDMRWIRAEFLDSHRRHSHMVVHGHSITESVDEQPNRIGIDTGAYASGCLTAIGLEETARWYLTT